MTNKEFSDYLAEVRKAKDANKSWRLGQTYFNVLSDLHSEIAETYRATAFDPFHRDERVAKFLDDLYCEHVLYS